MKRKYSINKEVDLQRENTLVLSAENHPKIVSVEYLIVRHNIHTQTTPITVQVTYPSQPTPTTLGIGMDSNDLKLSKETAYSLGISLLASLCGEELGEQEAAAILTDIAIAIKEQ